MSDNKKPPSAIDLSGLLLSKGITFCLYRFPGEKELQLAVEKDLFISSNKNEPGTNKPVFVIAPFIKNEVSTTALLQRLDVEKDGPGFWNQIEKLPDSLISWQPLPAAITKDVYLERIEKYLKHIRSGVLSKAILSRVIRVDKPKDFNVFHFFSSLTATYPDTFVNLFYIPGMGIWTGASPELLLKKEDSTYQTMALASTQPIKKSGDYIWRRKEEEEHRLVQEHIEDIFLNKNCLLQTKKGPYTIETGQVAHLRTDYVFEETGDNAQDSILKLLHPTPAIGGLPVTASLNCIARYEGYNRNYYTGYFGETNNKNLSRLYINLRCMQIGSEQIAIYVGGGISADSDPEEEWAETNQKSLTLLDLINDPAGFMPIKHETI